MQNSGEMSREIEYVCFNVIASEGAVGWAKRSVPTCLAPAREKVGTAQLRLCPPYDCHRAVEPCERS